MGRIVDPKELEEQFLDLREKLIKESEDEFLVDKNSYEYPEGWPEIAPGDIVFSKLGFSSPELEQLDAELEKSDEKIVQYYLDAVRPDLVKGPDTPNDALRKRPYIAGTTPADMKAAKLYNATVVTDDTQVLKHIKGKVHNPWVETTSAEFQNMLVRYSGTGGWGCRRRDEHRGSFDCHWIYPFITDSDFGRPYYRFYGSVEFRGFFSCIAHDRFGICRSARAHASLKLRSYQFGSECSRSETTILNHSGDRINVRGRYDGSRPIWFPEGVYLFPSTPTFVVITAHIYARARGSGSYAEVNFNDGPTNWVRALDLLYTNTAYGPPR